MFDLSAVNSVNDLINLSERDVIDLCNTVKVKPKGKDKSWIKRIQLLADHFAFILPEGWESNDPTSEEVNEPEYFDPATTPVLEEEMNEPEYFDPATTPVLEEEMNEPEYFDPATTPVLEEEVTRAIAETRTLTGSDEMPTIKGQLLDYLNRGTVATGGKKRTKKTGAGLKRVSLWMVPDDSLEEACLIADVKLPQLLICARACDAMKEKYFSKSDIADKILEWGEIAPDKVTNAVNFYWVYLKLAGLRPVK